MKNLKKCKKYKLIIAVIIMFIILGILLLIFLKTKPNKNIEQEQIPEYNNNYSEINKEEASYQENTTVEELKKEKSITGDNNLYEIDTEYDGRKILNIKAEIQYQVAFAGIFEKEGLTLEKAKNIFNEKYPEKSGIWVEETSRNAFFNLLKQKAKSTYGYNEEGFLIIKESQETTDADKKIQNAIKGEKQFIISFESSYSHVDTVTGNIEDYPFEQLDPYQGCDVCQDGDKYIIFISKNSKKLLTDTEILEAVLFYY